MEPKFWHERWQQSKLGFHQAEANGDLLRHSHVLPPPGAHRRMLVPLCGKSLDMIWLRQAGFEVVVVTLLLLLQATGQQVLPRQMPVQILILQLLWDLH